MDVHGWQVLATALMFYHHVPPATHIHTYYVPLFITSCHGMSLNHAHSYRCKPIVLDGATRRRLMLTGDSNPKSTPLEIQQLEQWAKQPGKKSPHEFVNDVTT